MAEDRDQQGGGRQLYCRVITPEEVIYDGEADLVIARIADGDIGVLVDHSPLVSTVEAGEVRIRENDEQRVYATSDEIFKVSEDAEDRERVLEEIRRRQRTGENFVRLARKYKGS